MDLVDLDCILDEFEAAEEQHVAEKSETDARKVSSVDKLDYYILHEKALVEGESRSNGTEAHLSGGESKPVDISMADQSILTHHIPLDVTHDIVSSVDQEPEDTKLSPVLHDELVDGNIIDNKPPPDVVAGLNLRSRSLTPSPVADTDPSSELSVAKEEDRELQSNVSEEEVKRYLSELEEKIGRSPIPVDDQKEENRRVPSSDELQTYLANLEKLSGENLISEANENDDVSILGISSDGVCESPPVEPMIEKMEPEEIKTTPIIDFATSNTAISAINGEVPFEIDEEEREEDPYITLAFSAPSQEAHESTVCTMNLKMEIEQALAATGESNFVGTSIQKNVNEGHSDVLENEETISGSGENYSPPVDDGDSSIVMVRDAPSDDQVTPDEVSSSEIVQEERIKDQGESGVEEETSAAVAVAETADNELNLPLAAAKRQLVAIYSLDLSSTENEEASNGGGLVKLTESELQLGRVQPVWIPDDDSAVCMLCEAKFTVIRRRHHCRACGRVLCNVCCSQRANLPYLSSSVVDREQKKLRQKQAEARVCNSCFDRLKRIEAFEKEKQLEIVPVADGDQEAPVSDQATASASTSSTAGPSSPPVRPPALKREGSHARRSSGGPKHVIFSDGIKPGGDLTETPSSTVTTPSQPPPAPAASRSTAASVRKSSSSTKSIRARELESFFTIPGSVASERTRKWPPVITENGQLDTLKEEDIVKLFEEEDKSKTVVFSLKRNLQVRVKLTEIDCCLKRTVWCLSTEGLRNVSQDEILIVVEFGSSSNGGSNSDGRGSSNGEDNSHGEGSDPTKAPEGNDQKKAPPLDIFVHINSLYEEALKGKPLADLTYSTFSQFGIPPVDAESGYLGSKDNAGFLYFRPTYQCFQNLCLPEQPFLIGILIQKSEVSWAKVLPLRLLLRLGIEYRYYPYPLLSDPNRKSLFYETGHTIMNLLTDMRSFTYTLPSIPGCTVTLEGDKTVIHIPVDQYNQVLKILQSSNEHVLAWAASFHKSADAHLVCVQQPDTLTYTSRTINRENRDRRLTGACFVVFNASLKAGAGASRVSIVEDGLMVQIRPDSMERLRQSLQQQQPFDLLPSAAEAPESTTDVNIRWIQTVEKLNRFAIKSHVDGRVLTDAPRYRLHGKPVESTNGRKLLRLIELYVFRDTEDNTNPGEPDDLQSMVRQVAIAFGTALLPFVDLLDDANMKSVAVRFAMGADLVEYSIGSNGTPLGDPMISAVDDVLIPLLHSRANGDGNNADNNLWRVELVMRLLDL